LPKLKAKSMSREVPTGVRVERDVYEKPC